VGQDEDAQPLVWRTDFCRAEQARRRRVTHAPKFSQHGFKPEADVSCDVFEEDPFGAAFPDDAGNVGPEVPRVVSATAFPGRAEGLARVACEDGIEGAAEGVGVE
jgi:hypothetical protein